MKKQDNKKRTVIDLDQDSQERRWIEHQENATKSIIMAIDTMIELAGTDNDILKYAPKLFAGKLTNNADKEDNDLVSHAEITNVQASDNEKTSSKKTEKVIVKKEKDSQKPAKTNNDTKKDDTDTSQVPSNDVPVFKDAGLNVTDPF